MPLSRADLLKLAKDCPFCRGASSLRFFSKPSGSGKAVISLGCTKGHTSQAFETDKATANILKAERQALGDWNSRPAQRAEKTHEDDIALDNFAAAMRGKLAISRYKGRAGWNTDNMTDSQLCSDLIEHIGKGNEGTFEDVAIYAMMLHQRRASPTTLKLIFDIDRDTSTGERLEASAATIGKHVLQCIADRFPIGGEWPLHARDLTDDDNGLSQSIVAGFLRQHHAEGYLKWVRGTEAEPSKGYTITKSGREFLK